MSTPTPATSLAPLPVAGPDELLDVRVTGTPAVAVQALARLRGLFATCRYRGPFPLRRTPGLVRFYLTGRLDPAAVVGCERAEWLCTAVERVRGRTAAALDDELADRQAALEQADASLGALVRQWRSSSGHACRARASRGRAVR